MGLLNKSLKLFWDGDVSSVTLNMYNEINSRNITVSDFNILNDKSEWMSIPFDRREDVLTGLVISNVIKQSFGTVLLPILGVAIPLEEMASKAMMAKIEGRLGGGHGQLISQMIVGLNSKIAIKKVTDQVAALKELEELLSISKSVYAGVYGWTAASSEGVLHPEFNTFDELQYSIWQASALAIVMLGSGGAIAMASAFNLKEQGYKLPGVTKAIRHMAKDTSLITTYLTIVSGSAFRVLPEDRQEQGKLWLQSVIDHNVIQASNDMSRVLFRQEDNKKLSSELFRYNVNKSLVSLRFYPKTEIKGMPEIIEKHLLVDTDEWVKQGREEASKRARRRWF